MTFINRPTDLGSLHASLDERSDQKLAGRDPAAMLGAEVFQDLNVSITDEDRAFWCMMKPRSRPSFTPPLLSELLRVQDLIRSIHASGPSDEPRPFDWVVLGSDAPGVFNLGGDLTLFVEKIRAHDVEGLRRYGYACSDVAFANHVGYGRGIITIGLIEGDALGGGWESAASCDVLVAERSARFGLPEILFNLFPGMGAYSFLSRRLGAIKAEELIFSGRIYSGEELHALGLVDVLAEDGQGRQALRAYIAANRAKQNAHSALYKVRRRVNPVPLDELRDVVDIWVDAAMSLTDQDLRKMMRIAAAQDRFRERAGAVQAAAA